MRKRKESGVDGLFWIHLFVGLLCLQAGVSAQIKPLCAGSPGCKETRRLPAGRDAEGNSLTVVELTYPDAPEEKREGKCLPAKKYVLLRAANGKLVDSRVVVVDCQIDPIDKESKYYHDYETTVLVSPNQITVDRNGGAFAGFYTQTLQLSPWRPVAYQNCEVDGDGSWRGTHWDWTRMEGREYGGKMSEDDPQACSFTKPYRGHLMLPHIHVDADALEKSGAHLGSCAMSLDASGQNGYVVWGKPDPKDPIEIKLVMTSPTTVIAQVIAPDRLTGPPKSWIYADHFEIWKALTEGIVQFGIPVDDGPVEIGSGKTSRIPKVRRWKSKLSDGRMAALLRIDLPPHGGKLLSSEAFTVVYSQGAGGTAQKRMISTNSSRRGGDDIQESKLAEFILNKQVGCAVKDGALERLDAAKPPFEAKVGPLGQPIPEDKQ